MCPRLSGPERLGFATVANAPANGYDAAMSDTPETHATDTPPDRLSVDPRSPFFSADALGRGVGILFKGQERFNVEEYCVSEGWVRLAMPRTKDRHGNQLTMKMQGAVEPFFKTPAPVADAQAE